MKNFVQTGKNLTFLDSQLTKPSHASGFTAAGDPVLIGRIAGVATNDALASTDNVVVQTDGVFNLSVSTIHNGLSVGETVYIDPTTCALTDDQTDTPFGVALAVVAMGATTIIPVKLFGATPGATGFFS